MKDNLYKKEGMAQGAVGAIITLIVGVGVAVLVLIFVGALGGQTYNLVESDIQELYGVVTNDTFTASSSAYVSLTNDNINTAGLYFHNATSGALINSENFTINYADGAVKSTALWNGKSLFANYTYGDLEVQDNVKNSIKSGFEALEQTGDYIPIIVLAVVISLVLFLVLSMMNFGGMSSGRNTAL